MLRLNQDQRTLLAEKLCDAGNLAAGALLLGQAVGGARFSVPMGVTGMALWIVAMGAALYLRHSKRPE